MQWRPALQTLNRHALELVDEYPKHQRCCVHPQGKQNHFGQCLLNRRASSFAVLDLGSGMGASVHLAPLFGPCRYDRLDLK
jgi:hypothetical protein